MAQKKNETEAKRPAQTKKKTSKKAAAQKRVAAKEATNDVVERKVVKTETTESMNEAKQVEQTPMELTPVRTQPSSGKGIAWLALFCGLVALGASGYAWYQTAVNARLAGGAQSNRLQNVEQKVTDFGASQSTMEGQIDQIAQQVADSETSVAKEVSAVKQLVSTTESNLGAQVSEVKQQIAKAESNVNTLMSTLRSEVNTQQATIETQVSASQQGLEEQSAAFRQEFETLSNSIGDLKAELGTSVEGWSLREIEHLLVLANQRVQLGKDAVAAQQALALADTRLEAMDNPKLVATRQSISTELAALSSVNPVDYVAASSKLNYLSDALNNLPMQGVVEISGPERSTDESTDSVAEDTDSTVDKVADVGRSFLTDLTGLVQIEKNGESIAPSMTPELQVLNIAKAQLILEGAQSALLQNRGEIFVQRLDAAEAWVTEKFVASDELTKNWLSELGALKDISLNTEYPDVSGSLTALRAVIQGEG